MYDYPPTVKYYYKYLPMRVSNSPDIYQQKMNDIFQGFEFIFAYTDKLLILTKGYWKNHLQKLGITLNKSKENILIYNI